MNQVFHNELRELTLVGAGHPTENAATDSRAAKTAPPSPDPRAGL